MIKAIDISTNWQPAADFRLSQYAQTWLLDNGSLTTKLRQQGRFALKVVQEQAIILSPSQQDWLETTPSEQHNAIQRDVLLLVDDIAWVYAQSILPMQCKDLLNLGSKPLGEVIFNDPSVKRSTPEVALFSEQSEVGLLASRLGQNGHVIGRRSKFTLATGSICIAELFLPASGVLKHE